MTKIAIVGTGGMAKSHAKAFQNIKDVVLVACCDVVEERAQKFAETFKIANYYTDYKKMIAKEKLDGISIVSNDASHAVISIAALKAKISVLCEKPMAVTLKDAQKMVSIAKAAGVIHMINFSKRDSSAVQAAKAYIDGGNIGRVMHVDAQYLQSWLVTNNWGDWRTESAWLWRLSQKHGSGGVLGDIGCHIYDLAGFLCGDIKEIFCTLKAFPKAKNDRIDDYVLDANDSFVSNVEFKNGALGTVHCSRWATGHLNREYICIYGDKGAVEIDFEKGQNQYRRYDLETQVWETVACRKTPSNYERFVSAIRTKENDVSDFSNGLLVQKYLDASFKSSATKKPVSIA